MFTFAAFIIVGNTKKTCLFKEVVFIKISDVDARGFNLASKIHDIVLKDAYGLISMIEGLLVFHSLVE
jgi:hypothetical protein